MTKLFLKVLKNLILSSLILVSALSANAQMECRSMLGGHLTPFHKDVPLLWAIEGTMAPGYMGDFDQDPAILSGGMVLAALDLTIYKKHNFYVEGGVKKWKNSALSQDMPGKSRPVGIRQGVYNFNGETTNLKLGLHETKLGDFFLIDERVMGASLDQEMGAFTLNVRGGSVLQNFARMGQFCANRHIYNIIGNNYTENIGKKFGETNFAGVALNWNPDFEKEEEGDEFSEFSEFDEFSDDSETKKDPFLSNVSIVFYDEFGTIIPDNKLYAGSIIDFSLPLKFTFQTGAVYQSMLDNNSVVYIGKLKRAVNWKKVGMTQFAASYIGKYNIDDNAVFQPLFSNLFVGEIMRLDAPDFPLWQVKIKHNFPSKIKFHVGFKAMGQIENNQTSEVDFELGMKLFKHAKISTIFSRVESKALAEDIYMGRLELRVAF